LAENSLNHPAVFAKSESVGDDDDEDTPGSGTITEERDDDETLDISIFCRTAMTHETPTKVTTEVATTLELHEDDLLSPLLFSLTSNCVDSPPPCGLDDEEAPLCVPTRYLYPPPIRDVVNRMRFSSYYVFAKGSGS
jgi:hypothetical protein